MFFVMDPNRHIASNSQKLSPPHNSMTSWTGEVASLTCRTGACGNINNVVTTAHARSSIFQQCFSQSAQLKGLDDILEDLSQELEEAETQNTASVFKRSEDASLFAGSFQQAGCQNLRASQLQNAQELPGTSERETLHRDLQAYELEADLFGDVNACSQNENSSAYPGTSPSLSSSEQEESLIALLTSEGFDMGFNQEASTPLCHFDQVFDQGVYRLPSSSSTVDHFPRVHNMVVSESRMTHAQTTSPMVSCASLSTMRPLQISTDQSGGLLIGCSEPLSPPNGTELHHLQTTTTRHGASATSAMTSAVWVEASRDPSWERQAAINSPTRAFSSVSEPVFEPSSFALSTGTFVNNERYRHTPLKPKPTRQVSKARIVQCSKHKPSESR